MGIFNFSKKSKKHTTGKGLGFETNQIKVGRYARAEFEPVVGEAVKLWNKPDTDEINFYAKGTSGGEGLLGWITNGEISNHLRKSGLYDASISSFNSTHMYVNVQLKDEYKTHEDYRAEQREKWSNQLSKTYKPKTDWTIQFHMKEGFRKTTKVVLRHKSREEVEEMLDDLRPSLWIEDLEGNVISEHNYIQTNEVIRTLRAYYSGLDIQIKAIQKTNDSYDFTIGVAE